MMIEIENLLLEFRNTLKKRFVSLKEMRKITGVPKSTLSYGFNLKTNLNDKTKSKMNYWIKHNEIHPMMTLDKQKMFWCFRCDEILPLKERARRGKIENNLCYECRKVYQREYCKNNPEITKQKRRRYTDTLLIPGSRREHYLQVRHERFLRRTYGEYVGCKKLIDEIKRRINVKAIKFR